MEQQCASIGCTKPAVVPKVTGADISMTSTSAQSVRVEEICYDCDAQDKRMEILNQR